MKVLSLKIAGLLTVGVLMAGVIPTSGGFWYDPTEFAGQMVAGGGPFDYTINPNGELESMVFTGNPTGVGGIFDFTSVQQGSITVTDSQGVSHVSKEVSSGSFVGYTTDRPAEVLSISQLSFPNASITDLKYGLDIAVVPETSTMIAGALLLFPFGASAIRILRKNRVR